MDYGNLSLTYEIMGKLYMLAFILNDSSYTREEAFETTQEILSKMDELAMLQKC
jgi:hypothetical protein